MSKYNKTTKYWLQLKEDWFEEDSIKWIEEQKNGKEYSLFYLKMMLKSIKTNGILIRQVGQILIPYSPQGLADLTNTEVDTVIVAFELLKKVGLIEILDDGAVMLRQVREMIGCATEGAYKKAIQRVKQDDIKISYPQGGGQMSAKLSTKVIDIDLIDKNINNNLTYTRTREEEVVHTLKQGLKFFYDKPHLKEYEPYVEIVINTMMDFMEKAKTENIKFNRREYSEKDIINLWCGITEQDFFRMLSFLKNPINPIQDENYYILGCYVNSYDRTHKGGEDENKGI